MSESQSERAQLWALYFGLRALPDPPSFLRHAEIQLKDHLGVDHDGAPRPPGRPSLHLVGGPARLPVGS